MMLSRGGGVALWRQIAEAIEADIERKTFPPGGRLPTEEELSARFGVNRHTVRRAIAMLQDQGLVRVEQGRGTFVQEGVIDYPLSTRTRFSEIIRRQARTPSGELLRTATLPADPVMAKSLGLDVGAPVVLVETLGKVDGAPVSIAAHYFSQARFPDLIDVFRTERGVTQTLRRLGIADYRRKQTRVTARLPDSYEMRHLQLSKMIPVLVAESINVDDEGRPLEWGVTRFAANRIQIVSEP